MSHAKFAPILTNVEQLYYYAHPQFTQAERQFFFSLDEKEKTLINGKQRKSAVYTILQFGYFKAKRRFFDANHRDAKQDIMFILQDHFGLKKPIAITLSRNTKNTIENSIARFLRYETDIKVIKKRLSRKACQLVRLHNDPRVIFQELLHILIVEKMMLPAYSTLQEIIGTAVNDEEDRLTQLIQQELPSEIDDNLKKLLTIDESLYQLTCIKRDLTGFNYQAMQGELDKHNSTKNIYLFSCRFLPLLGISRKNIDFYASHIDYYPAYKLNRMPQLNCYLYLICYVYHRHQNMNNNLIEAFIYHVDNVTNDGKKHAKETSNTQQLFIPDEVMSELIGNYANDTLFDKQFGALAKKAQKKVSQSDLKTVSEQYNKKYQKNRKLILEWAYYEKHQQLISMNIRQLFLAIHFESDNPDSPLFKSVKKIKYIFNRKKSLKEYGLDELPKTIIDAHYKLVVLDEEGQIKPNVYEFLIYQKLRKMLDQNKVYVNHSTKFRSFEQEIKSHQPEKSQPILTVEDVPKLKIPIIELLKSLKDDIHKRFIEVNENIESGKSQHVRIKTKKGKKTWNIKYPATPQEFNHKFYELLPLSSISEVFDFVDAECEFMHPLVHFKNKDIKLAPNRTYLKAGIIAEGTRQGNWQMAARSNLNYQLLCTHKNNCIRLSTLKEACKKISDKMLKLPIFEKYKILDQYFSGIDGSKKGAKKPTSKARYSPKYFGLMKGLVSLIMLINNIPVSTLVSGCNEYEGHFAYQLYEDSDLDFNPDVLCTDTHGVNAINFLLFFLQDTMFAPCFKNIADKAENLYAFGTLDSYQDLLIKPHHIVNEQLIIDQWPKIQEILLALLNRECDQQKLIKQICNYKSQNDLKKALWELNNVFLTQYILKYVDNVELIKAIRKTLNRTEAFNKLYNAIVSIGGKKFKGDSDVDMAIENECTRLLSLVIIFYNMRLLSDALTSRLDDNDMEAAAMIMEASPLAIQHINLAGIYQYTDELTGINISEIVKALHTAVDNALNKPKKAKKND